MAGALCILLDPPPRNFFYLDDDVIEDSSREDPIGFGGDGTNFYIYVDDNPVVLIDPLGPVHCVAGANCNFTPPMRDALACFDRCTGRDNEVTSGLSRRRRSARSWPSV